MAGIVRPFLETDCLKRRYSVGREAFAMMGGTQSIDPDWVYESATADRLFVQAYDELRSMAISKMLDEDAGHTLQPTALVHEAWLRLGADEQPTWDNRAHFFCAAAKAMNRILVERARRKNSLRRGKRAMHVNIDGIEIAILSAEDRLILLDGALNRLAQLSPHKAELVRLRYFVGLTLIDAAKVLEISEPTAKRWWTYARAWLYRECHNPANPNLSLTPALV
jgi:RNA polymerase sigma factor (TIGR02999 family)